MIAFTFYLNADNDLQFHSLAGALRSQRDLAEFDIINGTNLDGACSNLSAELKDAQEVQQENNDSIYIIECESEMMDEDEAEEALCYALFEGGGLNPDLKIRSIAKFQ